jgi:hypothetical protein
MSSPIVMECGLHLEEEELVKGLEDVDGGLVDGADDGAACVDDITHGAHHNGGGTSIQAGGRLVHEDYGGVGHQLHGNGEPLTLLHREPALPRETHLQQMSLSIKPIYGEGGGWGALLR